MHRIRVGIFLVAVLTLVLELALTRAFDVILLPSLAYMIITAALFAFGLAGIFGTLVRVDERALPGTALSLVVSILVLIPALNLIPFNYEEIPVHPLVQALSFGAMYLLLLIPFFLSGLVFTILFSAYSKSIQTLYAWDLTGAAVGCVIIVPFISKIGPGGLIVCAAGLAAFAACLFSRRPALTLVGGLAGLALTVFPFLRTNYIDFVEHIDKRGVKRSRELGMVERTYWDPISKIDVIDLSRVDPSKDVSEFNWHYLDKKHIAYDGGSQSSHFYPFDGNYSALRKKIDADPAEIPKQFWLTGVLLSHYMKENTNQNVLVIGSAGGQETKAALLFGARHVDSVELVGTVLALGKGPYADYTGNVYNHPNVTTHVEEGRSFLRASGKLYDIIQIFSNHTSSSIAAGTGAITPVYLQTVEAYEEYFSHLTDDGILHINHHIYPRMISTAAAAWRNLGRTEFQKHVVVVEATRYGTLPTMLIKMSPWTQEEVEKITEFFRVHSTESPTIVVENPLKPEESFLSADFYSGRMPDELARKMKYRISPSTDNLPFFNFIRKSVAPVEPDPGLYMNDATVNVLNSQLRKNLIPMDLIHLVVTGIVSLFFAFVFILVPLWFTNVGKTPWNKKLPSLVYFACLGSGFIIMELVFIQIFMKLVGYPLYTYSTVIFSLLFAAGLGSLYSERLGLQREARWRWPFLGILVLGGGLLLIYPFVFGAFQASPVLLRVAVAAGLITPLGFFLGMPFPLGILAIREQPAGAIAWAWGLNGLFTVLGSLLSVIVSMLAGFWIAIVVALAIYSLAFFSYSRMRA